MYLLGSYTISTTAAIFEDRTTPLVLPRVLPRDFPSTPVLQPGSLLACADESCATTNRGAAARAWEKIEAECREKLEQNRGGTAEIGWNRWGFSELNREVRGSCSTFPRQLSFGHCGVSPLAKQKDVRQLNDMPSFMFLFAPIVCSSTYFFISRCVTYWIFIRCVLRLVLGCCRTKMDLN